MAGFAWRLVRILLFWAIPTATVYAASYVSSVFSFINISLIISTVSAATHKNIDGISNPEFAYSLAGSLAFIGLGFLVAFYVLHVLPVQVALRRATRLIATAQGGERNRSEIRKSFAASFDNVRQKLDRNWLIGHAWIEFEETLFDTDSDRAIGNTVRPQAFFNPGVARARLSGLKMMNAVPGYFVGVGLMLTFIGLVFALYKAGSAANAGNAAEMANEMGALLQIATFKFSTSIAGLAASIVLSVFFRWYFVLIEAAFDRFNAVLERGLLYAAPQSISMDISRTLQDQLVQLKDITQGDFFARMGSEIAPRLNSAIAEAMAPVTAQIGSAIGNITSNSQDGVQKMLHSFMDSLQHGAGTEMRELVVTLRQLQMLMVDMQGGLRGSGDDFAAKLSEAADNLNRMVERAGHSFETSSTQSRDALSAVMEDLRQTMEKANAGMDSALGAAAGGASAKLEAAMGIIMEKLDRQVGQIGNTIEAMQRAMGEQGDQARRQIESSVAQSTEAQKSVLADLQEVVQGVSSQLRKAVDEALSSVGERLRDLATSMRAIEGALTSQKVALEAASSEARKTAEAFGESATSVRVATAPLIIVGDKFSGATEKLAASVEKTKEALAAAKEEIATLAGSLSDTSRQTGAFWTSFTAKFDEVDSALGKTVKILSESTSDQQQRLQGPVRAVDQGLAEAIGKLTPLLSGLSESAETIAESLQVAKTSRLVSYDIKVAGDAP